MPDQPNLDFDFDEKSYARSLRAIQQRSIAQATDPENDAARAASALDLADQTGGDPNVIYGNFDQYQKGVSDGANSELIRSNPHLQEYIQSDPMASKVSHGDWGNLDKFSETLDHFSPPKFGFLNYTTGRDIVKALPGAIASNVAQGIVDLAGVVAPEEETAGAVGEKPLEIPNEDIANAGMKHIFGNWKPYEAQTAVGKIVSEGIGNLAYSLAVDPAAIAQGTAAETFKVMSAFFGQGATSELFRQAFPQHPTLAGLVGGFVGGLAPEGVFRITHRLDSYVDAGEKPPYGVDPEVDKYHEAETDDNIKALNTVIESGDKTDTKARSAAFLESMAKLKIGEKTVSINPDGIRLLYGDDKVPDSTDAKLGWVPDIGKQVESARQFHTDVDMPMALYAAHIDKDVHKELTPYIRIAEGPTLSEIEEHKELQKAKAKPVEETKANAQGSAWTHSMHDLLTPEVVEGEERPAEQELREELIGGMNEETGEVKHFPEGMEADETKTKEFKIADSTGKVVGAVYATPSMDGKTLHLGNIASSAIHDLDPREVRDLLGQLQREYPGVEQIRGNKTIAAASENSAVIKTSPFRTALRNLQSAVGTHPAPEGINLIPEETESGHPVSGGLSYSTDPDNMMDSVASFKLKHALNKLDMKVFKGPDRAFALWFRKHLLENVGDLAIHVVSDDDMDRTSGDSLAWFNPRNGHIVMRESFANGHDKPSWYQAHVLMEEANHSMTGVALQKDPEATAVTRRIMGAASKEFATWSDSQILKYGNEGLTTPVPLHVIKQLTRYALTHPWELYGTGLGHSYVRNILKQIKLPRDVLDVVNEYVRGGATGIQNAWEAMRSMYRALLKTVFGIDIKDSALDAILRMADRIEKADRITKNNLSYTSDIIKVGARPIDQLLDRLVSKLSPREWNLYRRKIGEQNAKIEDTIRKRAEAKERKEQTSERAEQRRRVRIEARHQIEERPDIAAERWLSEGMLYNKKTRRPMLEVSAIPDDIKPRLDPKWFAHGGIDPGDMGKQFGYNDGQSFLEALAGLRQERANLGLTRNEHIWQLTKDRAEQLLDQRFGKLEENIQRAVEDHVLDHDLDVIHPELIDAAIRAGQPTTPLQKDILDRELEEKFNNETQVGANKVSKYMNAAMRAEEHARKSLQDENFKAAFLYLHAKYAALLRARLSRKVEKNLKWIQDDIKKHTTKRAFVGRAQRFTNWVHWIYNKIGQNARSQDDLSRAFQLEGEDDFKKFVDKYNDDLRNVITEMEPDDFDALVIPDWLYDPNYHTPPKSMTPGELQDVINAVKSLKHAGRVEYGELAYQDRKSINDIVNAIKAQLATFKESKEANAATVDKSKLRYYLRVANAALLPVEDITDRMDLADPNGVFTQQLLRRIVESSNHKDRMLRIYMEKLNKILLKYPLKSNRWLSQRVENNLIIDPADESGRPMQFTRKDVLGLLQNFGNASNREVFYKGMKIPDDQRMAVFKWLTDNTTKRDWDRAQAIGDLFKELFEQSEFVQHRISGVAPERIKIDSITTPYGTYDGWYHRLTYDPRRLGTSEKLAQARLQQDTFRRIGTPSSYRQARTGYAAPILFDMDLIPYSMEQMIRDITMYESVRDAGRIITNPQFHSAIGRHFGDPIANLFLPWLRDVAGLREYKPEYTIAGNKIMSFFTQNAINVLIGLNYASTVPKHAISALALSLRVAGTGNYLREMKTLFSTYGDTGESNWNFAMNGGKVIDKDGNEIEFTGSDELARRVGFHGYLLPADQRLLLKKGNFMKLRELAAHLGSRPVAWSDLASAVPTWLAVYKKGIREGLDHGEAVFRADKAVRKAHGTTSIVGRSALLRNPMAQVLVPFYNFFNRIWAGYYEMGWRARESMGLSGHMPDFKGNIGPILSGLMAFVVVPSVVEQLISPVGEKSKSETGKAFDIVARSLGLPIPVLRDIIEGMVSGRGPSIGLADTPPKALFNLLQDIEKPGTMSRQHAARTIRDVVDAIGYATGLTNAQEGKILQYATNVANGNERPKNIGNILYGLTYGVDLYKEPRR